MSIILGGNRDYIVVGSDSGKITILEYNQENITFIVEHVWFMKGFNKYTYSIKLIQDFILSPKG